MKKCVIVSFAHFKGGTRRVDSSLASLALARSLARFEGGESQLIRFATTRSKARRLTLKKKNPQIARRRRAHAESRPDAKIISLGIGDTTEPIPPFIAAAMRDAAAGLGTQEGYSGYGAEQGKPELRKAVCDRFYASCGLQPEEIFISDGSKCDIGRLQMMFGREATVALQDPAYPV